MKPWVRPARGTRREKEEEEEEEGEEEKEEEEEEGDEEGEAEEAEELERCKSLRNSFEDGSFSPFSWILASKSEEKRSKYVSRWASVASWGHLSRHEGAWGALWACGWLLGSQDEGSRGPKKEVSKIQGASENPKKHEKSPQ